MRVLFIVNPTAGKGRGKREWEQIQPQLRGIAPYDIAYTTGPGHATQLAREAAASGYDRVVAVGGDGTMFEVVNGLVGTKAALSVLPGGTGNDYAKCVGLPMNLLEAARVSLTGKERAVDVGHIAGRGYFINAAGAGFDAEVANSTNQYPKYFGGALPYVAALLKTLWRYKPRQMQIQLDDETVSQKVFLVAAGIGQSYGGGMRITPEAQVDDGLFDVCIAGDLKKLEVLRLFPLLFKGEHIHHPKVRMARCRKLAITAVEPTSVHADGELIGYLPLELSLIPGGLRLVVPN